MPAALVADRLGERSVAWSSAATRSSAGMPIRNVSAMVSVISLGMCGKR